MTKEEYNEEQVFYCNNCLSLKIRDVAHIENSEYCEDCGSTDIRTTNIEDWEALYKGRFGHRFLDNKY